jgi:hypothetical protein
MIVMVQEDLIRVECHRKRHLQQTFTAVGTRLRNRYLASIRGYTELYIGQVFLQGLLLLLLFAYRV